MPFNIKNLNNNPGGQLKLGGPVTILSAAAAAPPFQDGTFAHPFLLSTDGVSLYEQLNATPGVTLPTFRGGNFYGLYFKFTMPTITGLQKLRILGGISPVHPYANSDVDSYMGIHSVSNSTIVLSQDDDQGGNIAPPGESIFRSGASKIDINVNGSSSGGAPPDGGIGTFVAGTQYIICVTTYGSNRTTGGVRCAAYIV